MVAKFPPPPFLTGQLQPLNRWLIEIQSILDSTGTIDPTQINGYTTLQDTVATNTADIAALESATETQTLEIGTLQSEVGVLQADVVTINSTLTTLEARNVLYSGAGAPAGGLGNNGDWYGDTTNKHIYIKSGGAWGLIV